MKRVLLFTHLCTMILVNGISQDTTYYDDGWRPTTKSDASYYRIISKLDSSWRIEDYFANGQMQMEGYLNTPKHTDRHGDFIWYDSMGNIQETGSYVNGKKNGRLIWYYPNGNVKSIEDYSHGIYDGAVESYYEDGKPNSIGSSLDGQLHGDFEYWHENGQMKAKGRFNNGKQDGKWMFWDTSGNVTNEILFQTYFEFEECGISFEIPSNEWYYNGEQTNSKYVWHEFKRKAFENPDGINIYPNISIVYESVPDDTDVILFSLNKRRTADFEVDSTFIHEKSDLNLRNAIGYIGSTTYENGSKHTVYVIHGIYNNKGIQIIMDMTSDIYKDIGSEFDQAVKNIKEL